MKKPTGKTRAAPTPPPRSGVDLAMVTALAKIADAHDLSEVEIEHAGMRVRVARDRRAPAALSYVTPAAAAAHGANFAPAAAQSAPTAAAVAADNPGAVKSPMVGTAYLRPNPEAKPFVEVGSLVKAGDKILLVEAMKTFNDIVAPRAGKVTEIFVADGSPVEYGQPLLVIE
jgi:acetyl-CoA carboxylase biotin carboxyl carrier protein